MDEIISGKSALKNEEKLKEEKQNDKDPHAIKETNILQQKLSMVDLETALSYMLRREIPRTKQIQGETYDALVHWLNVLTKVCCHLKISECLL